MNDRLINSWKNTINQTESAIIHNDRTPQPRRRLPINSLIISILVPIAIIIFFGFVIFIFFNSLDIFHTPEKEQIPSTFNITQVPQSTQIMTNMGGNMFNILPMIPLAFGMIMILFTLLGKVF